MKKVAMGLMVVVMAISVSAFTKPKPLTSYYWFQFVSGSLQNQTSPPALGSDPFGCDMLGSTNCAQAFTSFTHVGSSYQPGTAALDPNSNPIIDKKQ
ncbi:MAG: hypothetical protein H0W12_06355 [Chitinophagaceae bacterium]|nr:hypothetical protein [Chitinophagaceae bacterium]